MVDILIASAIIITVIFGTYHVLRLVANTINKIEDEENNLNN